jgi:tetratricopeptide (TPR) repeat protein
MYRENLGGALLAEGRREEALTEFRAVIQLKPGDSQFLTNLVSDLIRHDAPRDAEAVCRETIGLAPDFGSAYNNLSLALKAQGKLEESLAALRQVETRVKPGSALAGTLPTRIRQMERMVALAGRLPAVLKGDDKPADTPEVEIFSQLCRDQRRYAAGAHVLADALAADPKLGDDRQAQHRYNAGCYAALAGCGKSKDDPPPDEPARAALRQQALDWLKAERTAWASLLESGSEQARAQVIQRLRHWQQDADLASVRDNPGLAQLPAAEQEAWRALWSDVGSLQAEAEKSGTGGPS